MNGLPYVYERLQPFKLDTTDKSCVCPDYCGVTSDVLDDAGVKDADLKALPRDAYMGADYTATPDGKIVGEYHIFSKSALGAHLYERQLPQR